jgi:hypothetical protein
MKNREILSTINTIHKNNFTEIKGAVFHYGLLTNFNNLKNEGIAIEKARVYTEKYSQYLSDKEDLFKSFADKDKEGNIVHVNGNLMGISDKEKLAEYQTKLAELNELSKEAVEEGKKIDEDYEKFLDLESSFAPCFINLEHVPADLNINQMNAVLFMISTSKNLEQY